MYIERFVYIYIFIYIGVYILFLLEEWKRWKDEGERETITRLLL